MPEPSFRRASARRLLSITACVAAVAGLSLTAVSASAAEPTTAIPHSKPAWVAKAAKSGTPATTATTSLRVYLAPKGGIDALKADALAVSTPGSATYRHFITPAQYRARYAPSTATVQSVETYLRSAGLTVTGVEASNRWISLTGDVATAQKAFHTTIGRFKHNGRTVQAPAAALSLPSSIASLVSTVTGLDTTPRLVEADRRHAGPARRRIPQRPTVLHRLRAGRREVQGGLQDAPAEVPGQDDPVLPVRLHRPAAARRV